MTSWDIGDHPAFDLQRRAVAAAEKAIEGAPRATLRSLIHGRTEEFDLREGRQREQLLERVAMLDGVGLAFQLIDPAPAEPVAVRSDVPNLEEAPALPAPVDLDEVNPGEIAVGLRDPHKPAPAKVRRSKIVRFAAEVCGVELWPRQAVMLAELTRSLARVAVWRLGRRSGKGLMAAVYVTFEATANIGAHLPYVRTGERLTFVLLANSAEQAGEGFRTIGGFFDRPTLAPLVARRTSTTIELTNGAAIVVAPTSARTVRGRATPVVVLDELAHAQDAAGMALSPQAASELYDAVLPGTMQFPAGKVLVTSTPHWPSGKFYDLSVAADDPLRPDVVGWHAASVEVNPTLTPDAVRAMGDTPASYAREVLARFSSDVGALFPDDLLRSCVASRGNYRPAAGIRYLASLDPAQSGDAAVLTIGHLDGETLIVDLDREWRARKGSALDYTRFLNEVADTIRAYASAQLVTDQWASGPIVAGLRERGITARVLAWTNERKAEAVSLLRQRLTAGTIELPANPDLIAELGWLDARPLPGGGQRIAAPPGKHDDHAMSLLGLVVSAEQNKHAGVVIGPSLWD